MNKDNLNTLPALMQRQSYAPVALSHDPRTCAMASTEEQQNGAPVPNNLVIRETPGNGVVSPLSQNETLDQLRKIMEEVRIIPDESWPNNRRVTITVKTKIVPDDIIISIDRCDD